MKIAPISLFCGSLALVCSVGAWHATQVRMPGSAHILNWMDSHGLVHQPDPNRVSEIGNASIILITDGSAIQWLLLHSWWFAGVAMVLALWSDFRRESTLLSGSGFVCGALALLFTAPVAALAVSVAGMAALVWLRRWSRSNKSFDMDAQVLAGVPLARHQGAGQVQR
jgi:hypothetical protein